jgi:hypothetical protein
MLFQKIVIGGKIQTAISRTPPSIEALTLYILIPGTVGVLIKVIVIDFQFKCCIFINPTTTHSVPAPMRPVSVSDERDKPDGSSSGSMRQGK